MTGDETGRGLGRETLLLALVVALLLVSAWTAQDWAALSAGRLPDTDDMVRLAQVRDWIGGQAFNDLTQHRLGPGEGTPMHWSRIGDVGPALLLLALTPLLGAQSAGVAMAILYPGLLFLLYLLLVARIARRLIRREAAPVAIVVAALAYPTVSLFVPGRIDHHGLQIILILLLANALVTRPSLRAGLVGGVAAAISLAVGLEAAPEILAAMAALFILWVVRGTEEDSRAGGFALGLGAATLALLLVARPAFWPAAWCDGFTPASSSATLVAAAGWGALALGGRRFADWKSRLPVAGAVGILGLLLTLKTSYACISGPYGPVDPFLMRVWMANVREVGGLFGQPSPGIAVAYGGLCLAGLAAAFATPREERPRWFGFTIFLALSVAAALAQIRVTYIVAGIATVPLVALIVRMRAKSGRAALAGLLAAWLAATGLVYKMAGESLDRALSAPSHEPASAAETCTDRASMDQVARLRRGTILAPIDMGAYLLGLTRHRVIAAPYHRNNAGNLAMYDFFLAPQDEARSVAARVGAKYVILCPSSFGEIRGDPRWPRSLGAGLQSGSIPAWLEPLPAQGPIRIYRIR